MSIQTPRRVGRPDQQASEELVRRILDAAARLFVNQGYADTSIEQIAAAACSGKQTIYRRFSSKERLFMEVISRQAERLLEVARAAESRRANPIDALKESCRLLLEFALHPDMVRLHRILVAEVERFPNLGEYVLDNCMSPFKAVLERLLRAAMDAGQLREMDVALAYALLSSLVTGWPIRRAMLSSGRLDRREDRDAFFEAAWGLFLRGAA